jgi:ABC-2 type transport system ATP-binding protein
VIQVKDLSKSYGDRLAIDRLNFTIQKGEVVGFLGPNGAGKSTTMKIITGYMAPTSGHVSVAGFDIFEDPLEVKKRIGYLPETPPVYMDMKVSAYLRFCAKLKGVEKSGLDAAVERTLGKTGLGGVKDRMIGHLSKGFRQRVGLAQALVSDPEILILDEPTVGLDPKQVAEIRSLINDLKGRHTIILSTHILPEVQASCDKVIIINEGKIIAEDQLSGLSKRLSGGGQLRVKVKRMADQVTSELAKLDRITGSQNMGHFIELHTDGSEEATERVAEKVVELKAGLLELQASSLTLEDIFIKLTGSKELPL